MEHKEFMALRASLARIECYLYHMLNAMLDDEAYKEFEENLKNLEEIEEKYSK